MASACATTPPMLGQAIVLVVGATELSCVIGG